MVLGVRPVTTTVPQAAFVRQTGEILTDPSSCRKRFEKPPPLIMKAKKEVPESPGAFATSIVVAVLDRTAGTPGSGGGMQLVVPWVVAPNPDGQLPLASLPD